MYWAIRSKFLWKLRNNKHNGDKVIEPTTLDPYNQQKMRSIKCKGFLLIELCFSVVAVGFVGCLLMYYLSLVSEYTMTVERNIEALFLARSCIEEYRAFKKSSFEEKGSSIFLVKHTFEATERLEGFHALVVTVSWQEGSFLRSLSLRALVPK